MYPVCVFLFIHWDESFIVPLTPAIQVSIKMTKTIRQHSRQHHSHSKPTNLNAYIVIVWTSEIHSKYVYCKKTLPVVRKRKHINIYRKWYHLFHFNEINEVPFGWNLLLCACGFLMMVHRFSTYHRFMNKIFRQIPRLRSLHFASKFIQLPPSLLDLFWSVGKVKWIEWPNINK